MEAASLSLNLTTNARGAIVRFPRDQVVARGLGKFERGGAVCAAARAAPRLRDATHNPDYCAFAPRSADGSQHPQDALLSAGIG